MDLVIVLTRTLFFYVFIFVCYRIMGKREIGQLQISDLTISILIAELVAISIENRDDNTFLTILPILLLVFLEVIMAYVQLKFNKLSIFMDGKPSIIISKGKINIKEMIKQRYSLNDLLLSLRENGIYGIHEVDYAVLETNGKLSIFKKQSKSLTPFPIIVDGIIDYETLYDIGKSKKWLEKLLDTNDLTTNDILYAYYDNKKLYIAKKNL